MNHWLKFSTWFTAFIETINVRTLKKYPKFDSGMNGVFILVLGGIRESRRRALGPTIEPQAFVGTDRFGVFLRQKSNQRKN
jgi:hypothetical protein